MELELEVGRYHGSDGAVGGGGFAIPQGGAIGIKNSTRQRNAINPFKAQPAFDSAKDPVIGRRNQSSVDVETDIAIATSAVEFDRSKQKPPLRNVNNGRFQWRTGHRPCTAEGLARIAAATVYGAKIQNVQQSCRLRLWDRMEDDDDDDDQWLKWWVKWWIVGKFGHWDMKDRSYKMDLDQWPRGLLIGPWHCWMELGG